MPIQLIPSQAINEDTLNTHVTNLISAFAFSLQQTAEAAVSDWGEETKTLPNAFMEDNLRQIILSTFIGFLEQAQPRADQLSTEHVEAYFEARAASTPPTPDPVEK